MAALDSQLPIPIDQCNLHCVPQPEHRFERTGGCRRITPRGALPVGRQVDHGKLLHHPHHVGLKRLGSVLRTAQLDRQLPIDRKIEPVLGSVNLEFAHRMELLQQATLRKNRGIDDQLQVKQPVVVFIGSNGVPSLWV